MSQAKKNDENELNALENVMAAASPEQAETAPAVPEQTQQQNPTTPLERDVPLGFETRTGEDAISDLVACAQAAGMLLTSAPDYLDKDGLINFCAGLSGALIHTANKVDIYLFRDIGVNIEHSPIFADHRMYVLQRKLDKIRKQLQKEQGDE